MTKDSDGHSMTTSSGDQERTTFAVVGTGRMAAVMVADLALAPFAEATTVLSRSAPRAREFADRHGIPHALAVTDLAAADADVVYVATPHSSHAELAVAALEAGRHVLLEKAFTVDAAEARSVLAAAEKSGRFLMEAMWMRFNPVVRRVQELLQAGAIGEPRSMHASFGRAVPWDPAHRLWDAAAGGGSLLDQGVYPLNLADLVFGPPSDVTAIGSRRGYDGLDAGVDTEATVLLGYGDGCSATTSTSIRSALPRGAYVAGRDGLLRIDEPFWCPGGFVIERPGVAPERVELPLEGAGYLPMLRAVHEAVRGGWREHPLMPWHVSLRVMELVDRVRSQLS